VRHLQLTMLLALESWSRTGHPVREIMKVWNDWRS
jgi:hypothetical protein